MLKDKQAAIPVLLLTIFIDLLGFGIVFPLLPNYAKEIGVPEWQVGMLAGSFAFVQFFASPFWGSLSDRIGRRPVILISTLISTVAYFVFGFANTFAIILISRILSGFGSGNISAAQAYIADITTPEKRAKTMGLIGAAFGMGFVFGPPLGGVIKTYLGIEYVGFITAGLCLLNFGLAYFILPESLKEKKKGNYADFIFIIPVIKALLKKGVNQVIAINVFFVISSFMFNISANLIWSDKNGFNDLEIGYVFSFIGVCTALTQGLLIGWFIRKFSEISLLTMGVLILMACLVGMTLVPKEWFMPFELIILAALAIGNGMIRPTGLSILSKLTDRKDQGQIMGVFQSLSSLSMGVGFMIATPLYSMGWNYPFYVGALILLLPLLLIWGLRGFLQRYKASKVT
jgi:DHA1 family tetracycline resistance protein-like MFS transporter